MTSRDHLQTRTFAVGDSDPAAQQSAIADVPTGADATAGDNATAINDVLIVLRSFGLISE